MRTLLSVSSASSDKLHLSISCIGLWEPSDFVGTVTFLPKKSYIMSESASVAQMHSNRSRNKNVDNSVSNEAVNIVTKVVILKPLILFDLDQQPIKI